MTGAEQLFEDYKSGGLTYLQSLVGEEVESQIQDFKAIANPGRHLKGDDKVNYSKALSGFANSDGGVVIWGVNCRKGKSEKDPDVVQNLVPISNLKLLISE